MQTLPDTIPRRRQQRGATVVEYVALVALISAIVIVIVATLGSQLRQGFQGFSDDLAAQGVQGRGE